MVQQGRRPSILCLVCPRGAFVGEVVSRRKITSQQPWALGVAGEVVAARELDSFRPRGKYCVLCEERGVGQTRRNADLAVLTSGPFLRLPSAAQCPAALGKRGPPLVELAPLPLAHLVPLLCFSFAPPASHMQGALPASLRPQAAKQPHLLSGLGIFS